MGCARLQQVLMVYSGSLMGACKNCGADTYI